MLYVFRNSMEAVDTLEREVMREGRRIITPSPNSRGGTVTCYELTAVSFMIIDYSDRHNMLMLNGFNPMFAEKDFLDRIDPNFVNPGKAVKFDNLGVLRPYLNKEGRLDYTYNERMFWQLEPIIDELLTHPQTRQAFMSIWDPKEDISRIRDNHNGANYRVPCSIGYHFLIRENVLELIYIMRSLDVRKCMPYDIYTSSRILDYVADRVGVDKGTLMFFVGSLHLFTEEENNEVKERH